MANGFEFGEREKKSNRHSFWAWANHVHQTSNGQMFTAVNRQFIYLPADFNLSSLRSLTHSLSFAIFFHSAFSMKFLQFIQNMENVENERRKREKNHRIEHNDCHQHNFSLTVAFVNCVYFVSSWRYLPWQFHRCENMKMFQRSLLKVMAKWMAMYWIAIEYKNAFVCFVGCEGISKEWSKSEYSSIHSLLLFSMLFTFR